MIKFAANKSVASLLSDSDGLHFRLLVKSNAFVTRNFHILFQARAEHAGAIPIPNECNMTELYRLTAGLTLALFLKYVCTQSKDSKHTLYLVTS